MDGVDPGELDQKITINRETLTDDGMGGQIVTRTAVASNVWAKARALSGGAAERFDKLNATAMGRFIIRYRDDIRHDDQIVWSGVEHNIRYIEPTSSRRLYLAIDADRGVAQ